MIRKIIFYGVLIWGCLLIGATIQRSIDQKTVNKVAKQYKDLQIEYQEYKEHSWILLE